MKDMIPGLVKDRKKKKKTTYKAVYSECRKEEFITQGGWVGESAIKKLISGRFLVGGHVTSNSLLWYFKLKMYLLIKVSSYLDPFRSQLLGSSVTVRSMLLASLSGRCF